MTGITTPNRGEPSNPQNKEPWPLCDRWNTRGACGEQTSWEEPRRLHHQLIEHAQQRSRCDGAPKNSEYEASAGTGNTRITLIKWSNGRNMYAT